MHKTRCVDRETIVCIHVEDLELKRGFAQKCSFPLCMESFSTPCIIQGLVSVLVSHVGLQLVNYFSSLVLSLPFPPKKVGTTTPAQLLVVFVIVDPPPIKGKMYITVSHHLSAWKKKLPFSFKCNYTSSSTYRKYQTGAATDALWSSS